MKLNIFFDAENPLEKRIYMVIYISVAAAVLLGAVCFYSGSVIGNGAVTVLKSRDYADDIRTLNENTSGLSAMASQMNMLQKQFEELKYPDRSILRDDVNKDLAKCGFVVQAFNLRDYTPPAASGRKEKAPALYTSFVEASVRGYVSPEKLLDFLGFLNRKDRFWHIESLEISTPDGTADFFDNTFTNLPADKKIETIDKYRTTVGGEGLYINLNFSTFVRN